MSAAVGPSVLSGTVPGHPSKALDAEIARYQKQLSDCEHCPSAKTPQGKANIQTISDKISAGKTRLKQIAAADAKTNGSAAASLRTWAIDPFATKGTLSLTGDRPAAGRPL